MENDIVFIAPQRSGHHAIINWIAQQCKTNLTHYNDVQNSKYIKAHKVYYHQDTPGNIVKFLNFENKTQNKVDQILKNCKNLNNPSKIFILRDCYNCFASAMKYPTARRKRVVDCWKDIANIITSPNNDHYYILYNKWFTSKVYRKSICQDLDIEFSDNGINEVSIFGGGSSFSAMEMNNKAQEMKTLERYKKYLNNKVYEDIFTDEIINLNKKIFNMDKPWK